jgi:TolB-like protein
MPSIIPGFEYDIFISYRHNDNHSGWVTKFVKALEQEIAATIKEPISVYFDTNPHDGLLETHSVDKSLEQKLKCLIFIPIISQTYCDKNSFAWKREFCAFSALAKNDEFGIDIKLPNGNIASRILPIKIHDLDKEDTDLLEMELGGVMRAVEFIYKEAGVNRPLKLADSKADNLNRTEYRNQLNKVANAIKEITLGLKNFGLLEKSKRAITKTLPSSPFSSKNSNRKKTLFASLIIVVALGTLFFLYLYLKPATTVAEADRSVAVLAFSDLSPNKDQEWFSDGLTQEILNSLANLSELKVAARTSSFYFKGKDVSLQEIAEKLHVAHVVEGSVRRIDKQLRINAQLIRAQDGFHIWSKTYNRNTDDLFSVQTDIAEQIAKALLTELTPEKKAKLSTHKPTNIEAYEFFLRGIKIHYDKYLGSLALSDFEESERYLLKSISLDNNYAEAYGALADLYDTRSNGITDQVKYWRLRDSITRIGLKMNPNSIQALISSGYSFMRGERPDFDSSFYFFKRAYLLAPDEVRTNTAIADFYTEIGLNATAKRFWQKALDIDPLDKQSLYNMGVVQMFLGNYEEAKKAYLKVLEWEQDAGAHFWLGYISILKKDVGDVRKRIAIIKDINPDYYRLVDLQAMLLALDGKKKEALSLSNGTRVMSLLDMKKEFLKRIESDSKSANNSLDPDVLLNEPQYYFVKGEPAFDVILERVRTSYAERLAKYGQLE